VIRKGCIGAIGADESTAAESRPVKDYPMTTVDQPHSKTGSRSTWDIDAIVNQLRGLREASLIARMRLGRPVTLPSRKVLASMITDLSAALFPNRFGSRELAKGSVDFFVGHLLDGSLNALVDEVVRELLFVADHGTADCALRERATAVVHEFADRLPEIRLLLDSDIRATYDGDPAARSVDEILACYPGITAIIHYRFAHALYHLGAPLVARIIAQIAHSLTGIDIHPAAKILGSFFIDHGTGVVIGETAVIGERVRLYHGVTLGAKRVENLERRSLDSGRHPVVEDDVVIYAGATILGPVTIGSGSIIGGNVWLTRSVPSGSIVSQAEVRTDEFADGSGI